MLWVSLPDQRARRELYWMSRMPGTRVRAMARQEPVGEIDWIPSTYRRPIRRFVEAGALAWVRGLDEQDPREYDWVTSLELCSLVTGQASRWRRDARSGGAGRPLQAVITWENLPDQPLYRIPPYRQALNSCRDADLLLCMSVNPGWGGQAFIPATLTLQVDRAVEMSTSRLLRSLHTTSSAVA